MDSNCITPNIYNEVYDTLLSIPSSDLPAQPESQQAPAARPFQAMPSQAVMEAREGSGCYSLSPLAWYLPAFFLTSYSFTLWYVFLRLGSLPNPPEFA